MGMKKIPVYCSFDKEVPIRELKPNPQNPNKHPQEQIELLGEIIKKNGWRAPITVSTLSGFIVKGHGRLMAAELLGCETVPVDFQDYENESLELADLMADNRIAELSYTDKRKLLNLFETFDTGEVEFELSGYTDDFYKELAHSFDEFEKQEENEDENEEEGKAETKKILKCPSCGLEIEV